MISSEQILYLANVIANKLLFKQNVTSEVQNILIVKIDEIGDMATCTHVFENLRNQFPKASITVLCKSFVKNLIENDINIDNILTETKAYNTKYDMVVELRGTLQTLFKSIIYKAKYRVSRAEVRLKNKGKQLHEIDTNSAIIEPFINELKYLTPKLYFSLNDKEKVDAFLFKNNIQKYAVIHAGARKVLRQWPPERFAQAAIFLKENYQLAIIFAGDKNDNSTYQNIENQLSFKPFYFTEGFSLSQFSYLCSKANFYIGNESGPLHIASAFNLPLVALYGPGVPNVFYPIGENSIVLHHVLSCNPCNQIDCVQPEIPCINLIQSMDVLNAIQKVLK